jgi:2-polyprenyl-6-hydroxyphenyl methylase/3-demethylubiquinone-9 3-methyltransferase
MQFRWQIAQFFELRWWQFYLHKKQKDAYLNWKKEYWKRLLTIANLTVPPGSHVLDAGCGPAGIFTILEQCVVDGLDPLLDKYSNSLQHFQPSDFPYVQFITESLETFRPQKQYDFVFMLNALNHVSNINTCLDQLQKMTGTGQLVVSVDAHKYSWLKRLFQLFPGDILHPHQHDLNEYENMLRQRGFSKIETILLRKDLIFNYYLLIVRGDLPRTVEQDIPSNTGP